MLCDVGVLVVGEINAMPTVSLVLEPQRFVFVVLFVEVVAYGSFNSINEVPSVMVVKNSSVSFLFYLIILKNTHHLIVGFDFRHFSSR